MNKSRDILRGLSLTPFLAKMRFWYQNEAGNTSYYIFSQYSNVRSLPGNLHCTLLYCTDCVGQQYLNSGTYDNVLIEFTCSGTYDNVLIESAGGLFCVQSNKILTPWSYDNVAL